MKRLLGTWVTESSTSENSMPQIGELIIDGNEIEFYCRGTDGMFDGIYIGDAGDMHCYKVVAQACRESGVRKTLEHAYSYYVSYVLQQNCSFQQGENVSNIIDCSFVIPELIDWIHTPLAGVYYMDENKIVTEGRRCRSIQLKEGNPRIDLIIAQTGNYEKVWEKGRVSVTLDIQPRIQIAYDEPVTVNEVDRDIRFIMQFWGLLIGNVSEVQDIRLTIKEQELKCWLYLNRDYSYNLRSTDLVERPRTTLAQIGSDIDKYFSKWYSFCCDEKYEFIRRMYFLTNGRSGTRVVNVFLQYVSILEGYSLRKTNDDILEKRLYEAIKKSKKEIKKLIYNEAGRAIFEPILKEALPEWDYNSTHAGDIANWIARGFIGRKNLIERLSELDSEYLNLVTANASMILKVNAQTAQSKESVEQKILQRIVDTRNFYAHYKADQEGVLQGDQLDFTINALKALIIAIWYSEMGMEKETIRKILMWDSELSFQTMYLRKEGEFPNDCLAEAEYVLG